MVHFKRDGSLDVGKEEPSNHGYRRDRYWKLSSYTDKTPRELKAHLAAKGYQCPQNANKDKLTEAVGRYERGLLSYEKYSADELRGRATRILPGSENIIAVQADDSPTPRPHA